MISQTYFSAESHQLLSTYINKYGNVLCQTFHIYTKNHIRNKYIYATLLFTKEVCQSGK